MLAYRVDLARGRAFLPDRARALGVPIDLWSQLQAGEPVSWDGGSATARRGAWASATRALPSRMSPIRARRRALPQFLDGCRSPGLRRDLRERRGSPKAVRNRHMTFREAATLARDAGASRLWITHFSPALEDPSAFAANATEVFPQATIGHDGLTIGLPFPDG